MIEKLPFGSTQHASTRILFGAAALGSMRQEKADRLLEVLEAYGVNHIDTAAGYGDSELRIRPWLERDRERFFLATKTAERSHAGARAGIERSLERLGTSQIDLIQLHNLVDENGWQEAFGPRGALAALREARERGQVRFLGVTGHGTQAARMHLRSLERFPFDAVLLPYSFAMMAQPQYAEDFEQLYAECHARGVAVQTIKSIARRRWQDGTSPRFSWYEPLQDAAAIRRAVHYVLARPGIFLNSSSDARLLPTILEAASERVRPPQPAELENDRATLGIEPLFTPGHDTI